MPTGTSSFIPLNPFDQRARANPYPLYDYMRTVEPIHHSPVGFWILTRYEDCRTVLESDRWSHDADSILEPGRGEGDPVDATVRLLRASVAFVDKPRHTQHRRLLEWAVRSGLNGVALRTRNVAADLISLMREKGAGADLVRDYAAPLPLVILTDLLGVPAADRPYLQRWGRDLAAGLDPGVTRGKVLKAGAAATAFVEYMADQLDAARNERSGGVIAALPSRSRSLRTWEVIADLTTMLVLGIETSRNLIANGILALLRHEDQLSAVRERPALMERGVEELIRYDGPIHMTARAAAADVEVGGQSIKAGEQAIVLLGAANHDPARFAEPHRLVLDRAENDHLGFGAGTHACFAAPMARMICASAIFELIRLVDNLQLAGEPDWSDTVVMRGPRALPVAVGR